MPADESHLRRQIGLDGAHYFTFRASGVGEDRLRFTTRGRLLDLLGDAIDRRAEDDAIAHACRLGEIERAFVDGAEPTRVVELERIAANAEDALGESAFFRRQADGA